jgi:hypothetical protein
MNSLSHSVLSKGSPSKLTLPNEDLAAQMSRTDSPNPSEQIANASLLKPTTPSRSLQGSSVSSTPKSQAADTDDKIRPILSNGFHDPPPSPLRRRRTRGPTISENTEAWEKSYVFSFGMFTPQYIPQSQKLLSHDIDGGGVRGLSTLYILKRLMLRIKHLERSLDPPATSSYHPSACPHTIVDDEQSTAGYYPCHYIGKSINKRLRALIDTCPADYMAGTSTGG